ncbi:MAG: hypothetical protein E7G36_00295 [Peptoniphilus rhinitidis]|uniref:hypothetical protein n=1 Tax=Peptoniphilus rhinitidis TaxID=1175452 RepID=UPI002905468C|nr:hypothetical protein [Peptoniphilus rhinitidis]MDU2109005.1 hypothetical protein [Peptoniphilus lacydonensis]MDU3750143.1 hypothetical protein [Peptoniphilus rhinitidis]
MCKNCECNNNGRIEVEIGNGCKMVCIKNEEPFEKDLNIFVADQNGNVVQDLAYVGLDYKFDDDFKVNYLDDTFSVKVFADSNNEDFNVEYLIPSIVVKKEKISVADVLRLENIKIEENTHGVLEYGKVNISCFEDDINDDEDFNLSGFYDVPNVSANYDGAYTDYTVYKNGEVVLECVSDSEVDKFVRDLIKKYK